MARVFGEVTPELLRQVTPLRWGAVPPDVLPLTAAEIDFPASAEIIAAVRAYADRGFFGYGTTEGSVSLRTETARVLRERHGVECQVESLVTTLGTAAGIWSVVHTLCREGDECIIFDPIDLLFPLAAESCGARIVRSPMAPHSKSIDLHALRSRVSTKTKLICLCNPHNPLGSTATREELEELGRLCAENDITLLADEVWSEIVYPPARHWSVAALDTGARVYTIYGPSKTFGIPGFRIGFVAAPDQAAADALRRTAFRLGMAFGLSPVAEAAVEVAFGQCWEWRDRFVAHLLEQRDFMVEQLNALPGVTCEAPAATYLLFPNITQTGMNSREFAVFALDKARVAVVPGTPEWFGPGAEGHIRISFATSRTVLGEAAERLARALAARRSSI